jgi:anionic cell wall polymer biosynthesis LytR-Cps2A-Psr (LCP) family protein
MAFKKFLIKDPNQPDVLGEGITRCSEPGSSMYWVEVLTRNQSPLYSYVRAMNGDQALQFCRARHPNAALVRLMEAS